jgi:hypothetical protein
MNCESVVRRFKDEILNKKVFVVTNYSYNVVGDFPDGKAGLIYIDADHRYESVKRDLNDWLPKLKQGGIMCGHDYGVEIFGVTQAVDEFCKEHGWEIILLNENGGDFALKKI